MPDRLLPDQVLNPSESLISNNGQYLLALQLDGNLVLYRRSDQKALWATDTDGHLPEKLIMQTDGNLVLYGGEQGTPAGNLITAGPGNRIVPLWFSGTHGKAGSWLVMQDDGNAVVYWPSTAPVWASNTVER